MAIRLLVDEDTQRHRLVVALRTAGYDVMTVSEGGLDGQPDSLILKHASDLGRTILTRNGDDYRDLHAADPHHAGILVLHHNKRSRQVLNVDQIVRAINNIVEAGIVMEGMLYALEQWNY